MKEKDRIQKLLQIQEWWENFGYYVHIQYPELNKKAADYADAQEL
tara:strand:- start:75 stop:209 length:135 start_codon:yes stop_codon:yes gene_type:complete